MNLSQAVNILLIILCGVSLGKSIYDATQEDQEVYPVAYVTPSIMIATFVCICSLDFALIQ